MNNPKIYGFCPAGCKWETVHRNEFDASKSASPLFENASDHTCHLIDKTINLLEENPYFDVTQHFKIYDGTAGAGEYKSSGAEQGYSQTAWNVELCIDVVADGEAVSKTYAFQDRALFGHEIDLEIHSICIETPASNPWKVTVKTSKGSFSLIPTNEQNAIFTESVYCDVYIKNIGYGATESENVEGCEDTRVYTIGYSKGFFNGETYTKEEADERFCTEQETLDIIDDEMLSPLEAIIDESGVL